MSTPRPVSRIAAISLSVALGIAGAALATPSVANAASTAGGPITSEEMFARAQYWVDQGVTYTQTGPWASDGAGKTYRRDCSGLVSMAWHLPDLGLPNGTGDSPVTGDFQHSHDASHPWTTVAGGIDAFQAGDAMVKDGHIELFVRWVTPSNHHDGAYVYSFNSDGETVQNPYANSSFGNRGKNTWSDLLNYTPIRYDKYTAPSSYHYNGIAGADFNGDGKVDVAGIDANHDMRLYTGNATGSLGGGALMWTGGGLWANFHGIVAGDFNGDGKADIAGIDANNDMRLYTGNGTGGLTGGALMWTGGGLWANFHGIAAGDFNGDGKADIAGIDANNDMRLFTGNGTGSLGGGALMWTGGGLWANFHAVVAGDYNADGKTDIAGIDANNDMRLYTGDGTGSLGGGALMWTGGGLWVNFHGLAAGDYNGDGKADIAAIDANSNMQLYTGNGTGGLTGGALMWPSGGLWAGF